MLALERSVELEHDVALLYEVASHDFYGNTSPEKMNAGDRESCIKKVARSLLAEWNSLNGKARVGKAQSAWDFIEQWSGRRLQAQTLWDIERKVTGGRWFFPFVDRILLNPLRLNETEAGKKEEPGCPIWGMLHYDLHLRNILAPKRQV